MSSYATPGTGALVAIENHRPTRSVPTGKSPVYAIDFSAVACGARIASTKRKIRWRFGFTNLEALDAGLTGQDCRGEEHDISLVWSIASGKRVVHVDQQEVHYSNSRNSTFEFSWTMRGNHVLKVVAHASAPITATPGFRQYNFFVDGLSFFSFPKVYRLNIPGRDAPSAVPTSLSYAESSQRRAAGGEQPDWKLEEPQTEQEEEAILKEIIEESLKEKLKQQEKDHAETKTQNEAPKDTTNDLLDFFSDPTPPANPSFQSVAMTSAAPNTPQQYPTYNQTNAASSTASPWADSTQASIQNGGNPYGNSQTSYNTQVAYSQAVVVNSTPTTYAAAAPVSNPPSFAAPAPVPTTYAAPTPAPTTSTNVAADPYNAPAPADTSFAQPGAQPKVEQNQQSNVPALGTENKLDLKVGNTLADQAYMKIANEFSLLSTDDATEKVRSNPFDTPNSSSGPKPTLEGLKTSKPETEKKEVMKSSGAMVVADNNNQQGNWGGYGNQYANSVAVPAQGYNYGNQGAMNQSVYNTAGTSQANSYGNYNYAAYSSQQPQYNNFNTAQQAQNQQAQYQSQTGYQQQQQTSQPGNNLDQYR